MKIIVPELADVVLIACEPLRRVHECVFGALTRESEHIEPRL